MQIQKEREESSKRGRKCWRSFEASWLRDQEEEVFGARSGADGQRAAEPRWHRQSLRRKHGTPPSNVFKGGVDKPTRFYDIHLMFCPLFYSAMAKIWLPLRVAQADWMVAATQL